MAGYTRQSAASIVALAEITAAPLNAEFNQLQSAFSIIGHTHSGVAGDGPLIPLTTGVTGQLTVANGGTGVATFTAGFVYGTGTTALATRVITGTAAEITVTNGSGVAGAPTLSIPTAVTFTGKTITGGTFASPTVSGTLTGPYTLSGTVTGGTYASATFTGAALNGTLGATTPSTAVVTTLTVNTNANPDADDGAGLGTGTLGWSDLFLASGALINIANANWVATHSSGILTVSTGDLRVTTAGTNAASVVTVGGTQTLTSKTMTGAILNGTLGATTPAAATVTTLVVNTSALPDADDGAPLGASGTAWSDLFLASGAVINIAASNWVATHTSGILTVGTGDLRVTTAGTNAASVVTVGGTQTLTSKTMTGAALNGTLGATTPSSAVVTTLVVGTSANPDANDGATLGESGTAWSDLFLADAGVINFAGLATLTHVTGLAIIDCNSVWRVAATSSTPGIGNNTTGAVLNTSGAGYFSAAASAVFANRTADGAIISLGSQGVTQGTISVAGATVSYNPFFGTHWSQLASGETEILLPGTIVDSVDELSDELGEVGQRLPRYKISSEVSSKSVYGVFHAVDPENEIRHEIGSLGAYWIRIAAGHTVQRGDLIESDGTGCGRVQGDDLMKSSTVGKVTSETVVKVYADGSYLVPCTLHCG